jgi:hypothetical protein
MKSNVKMILSAVGVAALLASPALGKSRHVPAPVATETNAVAPQAPVVVAPYAASVPVTTQRANGLNRDFQISGDR